MNRIIQQITSRYIKRLPEEKKYYRPDELHSYDLPSFLVQRINIELKRNLAGSMAPPDTDWVISDSQAVQQAWDQYLDMIRDEICLPASYSRAVFETAVADVLEMVVQPRKNIPEVVFGTEEELDYEQLCNRVESIVVYTHFGKLLPRYMQKKQLETLTKQRCRQIIVNVDQKMTARYTPLNWTQLLKPLFKLQQGAVDPNLLRLFFEDKEIPRLARRFAGINEPLNRHQVIEVLSSANDQPEVSRRKKPAATPEEGARKVSSEPEDSHSDNTSQEKEREAHKESSYPTWYAEEETDEESATEPLFGEVEDVEDNSLNALFVEQESPSPEQPKPVKDYMIPEADPQPEPENSQQTDLSSVSEKEAENDRPSEPEFRQEVKQQLNRQKEAETASSSTSVEDEESLGRTSVGLDDYSDEEQPLVQEETNYIGEVEVNTFDDAADDDIPMWKRFFTGESAGESKEPDARPQTSFDQPVKESTFYDTHFAGRQEEGEENNSQVQRNVKKEADNESTGQVKSDTSSTAGEEPPPSEEQGEDVDQNPNKEDVDQNPNKKDPFRKNSSSQTRSGKKQVRRNPFDPEGVQSPSDSSSKGASNGNQNKARPNKARFLNKPIFGGANTQKPSEEEARKLQKRLEDQREEFVEQIFKGSGRAFNQAILEISTYNTWKDASRYIHKEIFKRNLVNIYSEQAVEFTDRLQEYFTEKQNRN